MTTQTTQSITEKVTVSGRQLLSQTRRLLHEGNVRRIVISQEGRTIAAFPLTVGVVGAVLTPVLVAIGALATLLTKCTVEIERVVETPKTEDSHPPVSVTTLPPTGEGKGANTDPTVTS